MVNSAPVYEMIAIDIRPPRVTDAEIMAQWFNQLLQEAPGIVEDTAVTTVEEKKYLQSIVLEIHLKKILSLVFIRSGLLVAKADVRRLTRKVDAHAGEMSFGCLSEYEQDGIALLKRTIQLARKNGIKLLIYPILSTNSFFQAIFKKCGFSKVGQIPRFYRIHDQWIDRVWWSKKL